MTDDDKKLCEELEVFADGKGLIARPIIDQWGGRVGTDYSKAQDIAQVEAVTDGINGTVWTPPTADAYMLACTALERSKA